MMSAVMVSLDGIGDYNSARKYRDGRPSYEDVVSGINLLKAGGIRPTILTTVSNENLPGLRLLVEFVRAADLSLSLSLSRDFDPHAGLSLDLEKAEQYLLPVMDDINSLPLKDLPNISFNGITFSGIKSRICGGGVNYFGVDPEGGVSSCQMTIDAPFTSLEALDSGFTPLRVLSRENQFTSSCGRCMWKYVCCGGCSVLAEQAKTEGRPSVFCPLMKKLAPNVLVLEGRKLQKRKEVENGKLS
jgi:uncharacterized protein